MPEIIQKFKSAISNEFSLVEEGENKFRVLHPFMFPDGDHLVIFLRKEGDHWIISDEGHTMMHIDILCGSITENNAFKSTLEGEIKRHQLTDTEGVFSVSATEEGIAEAFFDFAASILSFVSMMIAVATSLNAMKMHFELKMANESERYWAKRGGKPES